MCQLNKSRIVLYEFSYYLIRFQGSALEAFNA